MYHVYRFLDKENIILYVGFTHDIQTRMRNQHFAFASHLPQENINNVVKVEHMGFKNKKEAAYHEQYYLSLYKPPYNTQFYENISNEFEINSNWEFYCSTENGRIIDVCNIGNDSGKTRALVILTNERKKQLETIATKKGRSFNNLMNVILDNYVKSELKL